MRKHDRDFLIEGGVMLAVYLFFVFMGCVLPVLLFCVWDIQK